jgi:hypothetical protein
VTKAEAKAVRGRPQLYGEATRTIGTAVPLSVIKTIDERAAKQGVTRSALMAQVLIRYASR